MEKQLQNLIGRAEAVSFDIFDTLIVRLYRKPVDLFRHLEEGFDLPGFQDARISAEQAARTNAAKHGRHEVTLDEIYAEMHASYLPVQKEEIRLELSMCRADPQMKAVFEEVKKRGLPIYIASDMYLSGEVVKKMLSNAGYEGWTKLFLSSETMRPKSTGEMYEDLIAETGVPADRILHIGDHHFTDYEMALKAGLSAYCYEPLQRTCGGNLHSPYFAVLNRYTDQNAALSILERMVTLRAAEDGQRDYWEDFGYNYIGILTYAYMKWLKERLDKHSITKVYFMSRGGYFMKCVFDLLFREFETHEIYGSKRLFLFAGMRRYKDIKEDVTRIQSKGLTYGEFYDRLAVNLPELKERYTEAFSEQERVISEDSELKALDDFFEDNEQYLLKAGEKEREVYCEILEDLGLFDKMSAVVDLDWKGTMLQSLEGVCRLLHKTPNLRGYYLGTHHCDTGRTRIESYLLDHGNSTGAKNADVLLDYGFTTQVLELAFSAPHPSVIKLESADGVIRPVYQNIDAREEQRNAISAQILKGVMEFAEDYQKIESCVPVSVTKEAALAPIEYLSRELGRLEQARLEQVYVFPDLENDGRGRPIFRQGMPVMGIINPWPGDMSAEAEVLTRFKRAAEENQIGYVMLDNFGHILDEQQKATEQFVDADSLSFIITTHYETPKILNGFHYHTLWNPPEIPLNLDYYTKRVTNNYIMNEDFLIYDSGGMSNHLRSMLMNCPRTLEGASMLTASFPVSSILPPRLDDPTMFYCGMNWEKTVHGTNRHEGLFKLLDRTGKVKFFGPESVPAWGGLRPWEGYNCYVGSIPFDGFSILKEINKCGICLVLSSDIHRRAGSATNRTYEACAAGAVIISDDNEFMMRNFKDAALFITYNKNNPRDTFQQIMKKYEWIVDHPEQALELARRAQQIFIEKYSLDVQMNKLVDNHPARFAQISRDLYARDENQRVLVTFVANTQKADIAKKNLKRVFRNIHGQLYGNLELAVAADISIASEVERYCECNCGCAHVIPMELFDKKGSRRLTDGQAIRSMQKQISHVYYINTTADEIWFYDHVTSLVRALEDSGALCAYSGSSFQDCNRYRRTNVFETLGVEHLFHVTKPERPLMPGQFLFHSEAHEFVPDYLFDNLDGREHFAYAGLIHYRYKGELVFTRRMSMCFTQDEYDERGVVVPIVMQGRLIQDVLRLYLPEQGADITLAPMLAQMPAIAQSGKDAMEQFLLLPLKNYIKIRYYRWRMRRKNPESAAYKALAKKYDAALQAYREFWNP